MPNAPFITQAAAVSMMTALGAAIDAGTAAVIEIYSGSVPADADAANAGTLLARLTCSATAFSGITDANPGARATFAAIANAAAVATGTASFFRIATQASGTNVFQGTVGTATSDMILNTVAITTGSTVSITSGTITMPEG